MARAGHLVHSDYQPNLVGCQDPLRMGRGQRPPAFPFGLVQSPRGPGNPRQYVLLPSVRLDPLADPHRPSEASVGPQPTLATLCRLLAAADLDLRCRLESYDDHDDVLDARAERFPDRQRRAEQGRDAFLAAANGPPSERGGGPTVATTAGGPGRTSTVREEER